MLSRPRQNNSLPAADGIATRHLSYPTKSLVAFVVAFACRGQLLVLIRPQIAAYASRNNEFGAIFAPEIVFPVRIPALAIPLFRSSCEYRNAHSDAFRSGCSLSATAIIRCSRESLMTAKAFGYNYFRMTGKLTFYFVVPGEVCVCRRSERPFTAVCCATLDGRSSLSAQFCIHVVASCSLRVTCSSSRRKCRREVSAYESVPPACAALRRDEPCA